jgi:hypothetical protein
MNDNDFKLELLSRNQIISIIELYQLPIDKTLSTKRLLNEIKKYVKIDDNGEIVYLTSPHLEGRGKKLNVNIKIF